MLSSIGSSDSTSYEEEDDDDNDSTFDMEELQRRMDQQLTQYYDLFMDTDDDTAVRLEHVYVIIFNPHDKEEQQGIHTIEFPKGSDNNVILAFESDDECTTFAQMLQDMQFYNPVPQMANLEDLRGYCQQIGVPIKVVPRGTDLRPPADNVEELSMNPNLRQDQKRINRAFMASESKDSNDDTDIDGVWE